MNISEEEWYELINSAHQKRLVPFLGAGASASVLPTGDELANHLIQRSHFKYPYPDPDDRDLTRVAQYFKVMENHPEWVKKEIVTMLKARCEEHFDSPPHEDLARLPVYIYLTTNYDDFMEHELISIGKDPIRMYPIWHPGLKGFSEHVLGGEEIEPSISRPIVYHLHGHWDVPESILVTEDDYINFLSAINNPSLLPIYCRKALLGGDLVFVGYSLRDWNIRVLLKQRSRDQFYPSYAIMPYPKKTGLAKFLEKDLSSRGVYILWGTAREFTNEFIKRWEVINN